MKKILLSLLIILSLTSFINSPFIHAQETMPSQASEMIVNPDYFPRPVESANFLGQDHSYSVTFRGNGEAVVSARMIFSNLEEATMSAMTLRIPRVTPQDVMVYQISREPQCIRYKSPAYPQINNGSIIYDTQKKLDVYDPPVCEEYQEPDYTQYWYGGNTYHKADVVMGTDSVIVNFPKPIKPNGSGAIIVYYRAMGYTTKDAYGAFNYAFETLKVEDRIRSLQVGISTDSDLLLKEATGKVDYQTTMTAPAMEMRSASADGVAFKNAQLDSVIQQIGYGTVVKSSSNLQPLDSYTVTGSYAESQWRMHGKQITTGIITVIVVLILLALLARFIIKRIIKHTTTVDSSKQKNTMHNGVFVAKAAAVGFVSAIIVAAYGVAVFFIAALIGRTFSYNSEMMSFFLMLSLGIISFAVIALLLFGPAIYVGMKQGIWKGVIIFAATIIWLKLFFIVLVMIMFVSRNSYYPTPPIYQLPMMDNAGSSGIMMK